MFEAVRPVTSVAQTETLTTRCPETPSAIASVVAWMCASSESALKNRFVMRHMGRPSERAVEREESLKCAYATFHAGQSQHTLPICQLRPRRTKESQVAPRPPRMCMPRIGVACAAGMCAQARWQTVSGSAATARERAFSGKCPGRMQPGTVPRVPCVTCGPRDECSWMHVTTQRGANIDRTSVATGRGDASRTHVRQECSLSTRSLPCVQRGSATDSRAPRVIFGGRRGISIRCVRLCLKRILLRIHDIYFQPPPIDVCALCVRLTGWHRTVATPAYRCRHCMARSSMISR